MVEDNTDLWGERLGIVSIHNNGKVSSTKRQPSNPIEDMRKQIDQQLKGLREEVIEYKRSLAKTHLDFVASIDNKLLNMISYQEFITFKLEMQDMVREHTNRVVSMTEKKEEEENEF